LKEKELILKHIRDLSDESVVEQWSENNYYPYFCGEQEFRPCVSCEASEPVHFRHRIGISCSWAIAVNDKLIVKKMIAALASNLAGNFPLLLLYGR